ncbi:MAG TPA: 3-dehydroquinate synthase [Desulfotignum sp.]|nr:3-dehydroquinate synthase [Desulfotignum sp.]
MKTLHIQGKWGDSAIHVGEHLANVGAYLPDQPLVIITDENIKTLYGQSFPKGPVITIGMGEQIKTLATVEYILTRLVDLGCDRSSFILGIGGGIVCDITGFAASIFLRGVNFGFVSTSLLSQVDASLGGKNGVNLSAYKNMVGVFNQPGFVICDLEMLQTLPQDEISNGLAEIVKHALIADADMLAFMEKNQHKALKLDSWTILHLVSASVAIKSRVVQQDEQETGERRKLNFGHTIGHAIEKIDPCGHGRAVSRGMAAATVFSRQKGWISSREVDRIIALLQGLNLPTDLHYDAHKIMDAAGRDKKKHGDFVHYVFLEAIGRARVETISFDALNRFIRSVFTTAF